MARLKAIYNDNVVPAMMEKFQYKSIMQVPKIEKIVLNMGVGEAKENSKFLDNAMEEMTLIAGQGYFERRSYVRILR
jgi:large subunit ribosomal protein L5